MHFQNDIFLLLFQAAQLSLRMLVPPIKDNGMEINEPTLQALPALRARSEPSLTPYSIFGSCFQVIALAKIRGFSLRGIEESVLDLKN